MADALLTIYCASFDGEPIVEAIRAQTPVPIHVREEEVFGRDFGDADTAEQVTGMLQRAAIELQVAQERIPAIVEAAKDARRRLPIRWHAVTIVASGRLA